MRTEDSQVISDHFLTRDFSNMFELSQVIFTTQRRLTENSLPKFEGQSRYFWRTFPSMPRAILAVACMSSLFSAVPLDLVLPSFSSEKTLPSGIENRESQNLSQ